MERVSFRFPTAIRFGAGARASLAELKAHGVERPLLVTDAGLTKTPAYSQVQSTMDEVWDDNWHVFSGVHPNPLEADADAGHAAYKEGECDAVIGLGGGSALDGAKAIVLRIGAPEGPLTEVDTARLPDQIVPLAAIPTTAGTGSETGRSTVFTASSHGRKTIVGCPALLPQLAILDPELCVSLPAQGPASPLLSPADESTCRLRPSLT